MAEIQKWRYQLDVLQLENEALKEEKKLNKWKDQVIPSRKPLV